MTSKELGDILIIFIFALNMTLGVAVFLSAKDLGFEALSLFVALANGVLLVSIVLSGK